MELYFPLLFFPFLTNNWPCFNFLILVSRNGWDTAAPKGSAGLLRRERRHGRLTGGEFCPQRRRSVGVRQTLYLTPVQVPQCHLQLICAKLVT